MKKQRAVNRLLSVILAIIMVFELLPAGLVVHAKSKGRGSGTENDPVVVNTFAELQEALESTEVQYIRVDGIENSEGKDYYELDSADCHKFWNSDTCAIFIRNDRRKNLELNSVIDIRAKDESIDYLIGNKGELTVYGNGGIVFSVMSENRTSCVFGNWGSGRMSVWGNVNIEGKNDRADGSCAALYAEGDYQMIDIRGGRFKGTGQAAVVIDHGSSFGGGETISGGLFENGTEGNPALYIIKDVDLKLSGGTFKGIKMVTGGAASDLSAYLESGCDYGVNGVRLSGSGLTELEGEIEITNEEIPNIDISIQLPVDGEKPQEPVVTTEDVYPVTGSVKWMHIDGDKQDQMSWDESFIACHKYRVVFELRPLAGSGRYFVNGTVVRVNSKEQKIDADSDSTHFTIHCDFTAPPVYIHNANVNVEAPKEGAAPKDAVSTTEHVTVSSTEWINDTTGAKLSANDVFEAGQKYGVYITVSAENGYGFTKNTDVTINNVTNGTVYSQDENEIIFSAAYTAEQAPIDRIDAEVITPVAGDNPQEAVCKTPFITFDENSWICLDDNKVMKAADTFEAGKKYELQVMAVPAQGYSLADNVTFMINDNIAGDVIFLDKDGGAWYADFTVDVKMLDSIAITAAPAKTTYVEGEYFDPAGMVVTAKYDDNSTQDVTAYCTFTPNGALEPTDKEIIVSYTEGAVTKTAAQKITILVPGKCILESISITKTPDKTEYIAGEYFEPAGMEVTATYSDNSSSVITGYTFSPNGPLTVADKEITVSYTAGDVTKTAKQAITVNGIKVRNLESIAVTKAPDKTTYNAGEFFDPTGMVVTAKYDDKSTEVVTAYTYEPTTALTASDTEITICYTDGDTKTATQPITVIDKNESLYVTFTDGDSFVYTGAKITPPVAVMYRGKALVEGVDYTVKYKNNVKASEGASKLPTVTVTGKTVAANGSRTFTITRKDIDDPDVTAAGITLAKGKTASPAVFYAGRKLGKNDINNPDAKVKFETDGTITIEGKGNFTGKRTIDVKLVDEKKIQVSAFNPAERIYNGLEQPLAASELTVVSGSTTLELGKDYEINYPADIRSAGTIKISVVGIGEYSGSVSRSYKISTCTTGINVDVAASVQYKAGGVRPEVTVTNGAETLVAGRDYTLKYSNNKAVNGKKSPSVKVSFKGGYKGAAAVTKEFAITACDISTGTTKIYGDDKAYVKSGKYLKAPYVEVNGTLLTVKDMDVTYKIDGKDVNANAKITDDMMSSGKVTVEVTVTGKGNYTGTVTGSYTISKAEKTQDISKAGVKLDKKSYAFTGENLKPVVTVQIGKGANAVTLKEGVDYKVEYFANVNKGKASLVITGLGDSGSGTTRYYGSKKVSFKIGKGVFNWL